MSNGPIAVSAPGTSLRGAVGTDITFNTRYPFAKLDSTNKVSFQAINIEFLHDPPNPNGTSVFKLITNIYTFPHGYKYIPAIWCIFNRTAGAGDQGDLSVTKFGPYGYENGLIAVASAADNSNFANLTLAADATNIYIGVNKFYDSLHGAAVNLVGYALLVRVYAFVNDLSGTDVPKQA